MCYAGKTHALLDVAFRAIEQHLRKVSSLNVGERKTGESNGTQAAVEACEAFVFCAVLIPGEG